MARKRLSKTKKIRCPRCKLSHEDTTRCPYCGRPRGR